MAEVSDEGSPQEKQCNGTQSFEERRNIEADKHAETLDHRASKEQLAVEVCCGQEVGGSGDAACSRL